MNMKKTILLVISLLMFAVATIAQPKAIGLRFGYNTEVSYQHQFGRTNFLQLDAGTYYGFKGLAVSPTFNFVFAEPNWTPKGEWAWYAGPGISTGGFFGWKSLYYNYNTDRWVNATRHGGYYYLGLSAMVGLSYTFWFPLQLSVDFRPTLIGFQTVDTDYYWTSHSIIAYSDFWWNSKYNETRFFYPNIAVSARYTFGR